MTDLEHTAACIADLGPMSVEVDPASGCNGSRDRPARLRITTQMERAANIGGGVVSWTLWADVGGNSAFRDHLNSLMHLLGEAIQDVGPLMACVRNAFEERRTERRAREEAEARLARVLTGRTRAFGEFFVRLDASGGAWLLDPEKRDRGWGLHFPSLAALWQAHPELRPVRWGADAGGDPVLIVAPMGMEA